MFWRISASCESVSESCDPLLYGGWCQYATTHSSAVDARSFRSQVAIGAVGERSEVIESRHTKWMLPRSNE
jgi:hypothetical protein